VVRTEDSGWVAIPVNPAEVTQPTLLKCGGELSFISLVQKPKCISDNKNRMAISKEKKNAILARLVDAFAEAKAIAFVGFHKLTVKEIANVRKELSKEGVRYYVAKKTLIRKALTDRGYTGDIPELPGEVAVAWTAGDDTTAPARAVFEHGKKLKGALALLGGVFDGAFSDKAQMTEVATIPPLPVLRGMFVNVINSPIQGLVIALNKIAEKKT
jgi:large subunit ribosomal protein L10